MERKRGKDIMRSLITTLRVRNVIYLSIASILMFQWSLVPRQEMSDGSLNFNETSAWSRRGKLPRRNSADQRVVRPGSLAQGTESASTSHDEDEDEDEGGDGGDGDDDKKEGTESHSKSNDEDDEDSNHVVSKERNRDEKYFSACLITMDDNHFWPEWIAYHYTFLNLRRMIVAVDPKSRTSPSRIFDRWRGLINITQWSDKDFRPGSCHQFNYNQTYLHRCRQHKLYQKCSETLKEEKTTTWVSYTDVDEYIVPNWDAGHDDKIGHYDSKMTILDIFDANQHLNDHFNFACFPMARVPVTIQESNHEDVVRDVPEGINATPLMTLRYRYPRYLGYSFPGKSMIDLSRVPFEEFYEGNHAIHRPIKTQCDDDDIWLHRTDSAFLVYHYPGSLEAFQFRDDPRRGNRRTPRHYYEKYANQSGAFESDGARFWIRNFVAKVGLQGAKELLEGAYVVGLE